MFSERSYRVLIIEDDPADREIYRLSLGVSAAIKFDFVEAGSAADGVERTRTCRPDCILLDYNLPDMDGLEVLGRIKGPAEVYPCPVVMLTAYGGEALAVQAMKAGVMGYLPKHQANADLLPRTIVSAIEKFRLQRQIEEQRCALEMSAQRFQVLLEAIPQMVWTATVDGRLEYANQRCVEYTGSDSSEALQAGWSQFLHPEDRERTRSAWTRATASGAVFEIEHRIRRASDGSYRWHLVRAVPMRGNSGKHTHWFGTCTEIEQQKRTEESRLEKQKLESVGRLAGGIAHDFNNLLAVILGNTSMVMKSLASFHPARPSLEEVISAGDRAAQLTRRLLAYAGRANCFFEYIRMDHLVRSVCDRVQASLPDTIRFEIESERDLPPIRADVAQVRQIIMDLVVNAAEAIGDSGGTISVHTGVVEINEEAARRNGFRSQEILAGTHVALEVRDTGCGMDEETQRMMFDPFYSTKFTGRGLGLAAVQGFVRSHRGGIEVDSAPGRGSRLRVLLPAAVDVVELRGVETQRGRS